MSGLRRLNDLELGALTDEELLSYIRRARSAGDVEAMRLAIAVHCYGVYADVRNRVRLRMESRSDADIDMVAGAVIESAMLTEFRGESIGELRALVTTILKRRVADYYRSLRGQAHQEPLVSEHGGDEEIWGEAPEALDEISGVWAGDLLERTLGELTRPQRAVIEHRLAGYSSKEAAGLVNNHFGEELRTPMTAENVDQIQSRFRRRHRDLIDEAERGDPGNEDGGGEGEGGDD